MLKKHTGFENRLPVHADGPSTAISAAWRFRSQSRWAEAAEACRTALSLDPACGQAWHLLGLIAHDQGQHDLALKQLKKAVDAEPGQALHYNNLGFVLYSIGRYAEAESFFRQALEIRSDYQDARCNLGLALFHQGDLLQAARCFEVILVAHPSYEAALANLGMICLAQQKYSEAATFYEKAIGIDPSQPLWHGNLGAAYLRLAQFPQAAACYRRAFQLDSDRSDYCVAQGIALRAAGDLAGSIRVLELALSLNQDLSSALANLVVGLEYTCQWDKLELHHPMLDRVTLDALSQNRLPEEDPMLNIRRCPDPSVNQAVSRAWSRDAQARASRIGPCFSHKDRASGRNHITVGYLSYDFRNHPVAHQLFPLFRLHDRNRFRVVAFSLGPDDGSVYRREIMSGCDAFVDLQDRGLAEAARLIYDQHIDILVDLMGHSHHNRMEILALRPAPVQIGYLGFLSTTGADFIDYLIADQIVVPKDHDRYYDEKLIRLPCYQLNHRLLVNADTGIRRQDFGLPSTGFVFCCFNAAYKIDRALFDTWMRILLHTPGAVLWLNGGHPSAQEHMRSRAETLGIDSGRLIFADKLPLEDHLQRLPLADLALDTVRYNGGATTANALTAGLPVITVMGRHWVSRMAASHLIAAGLSDLVFETLGAYEWTAIDLAHHPEKLAAIRRRMIRNTGRMDPFDPRIFVHHLETGFDAIWRRHLNGLKPEHIYVGDDTSGTVNE